MPLVFAEDLALLLSVFQHFAHHFVQLVGFHLGVLRLFVVAPVTLVGDVEGGAVAVG